MQTMSQISEHVVLRVIKSENKLAKAEAKLLKAEAKLESRQAKAAAARKIHQAAMAEAERLGSYSPIGSD